MKVIYNQACMPMKQYNGFEQCTLTSVSIVGAPINGGRREAAFGDGKPPTASNGVLGFQQ